MRLLPAVSKRRRFWLFTVVFGLGVAIAIVFALSRYPRQVLLSDVQQSAKIIVEWGVPDGNGTSRPIGFELDGPTRAQFVRELTDSLGLDYFRSQATVTPMIGIYLVNDKNQFMGYYAIGCARGGGRCPSMESLREMASKCQPLSEIEADEIFNDDDLRSEWPHILPWPECRYDYVLPVTPSSSNPLWKEMRSVPPPDQKLRHTLKGHSKPVLCVAFSPDGKTLATGSWDATIKLWDVPTGKNTATFTRHASEVRSVAFGPHGTMLASAGGRDLTVKLWDVATGNNTATLQGHKEIVHSVAFSPDGKILASGSWDKTIMLWDVATGKNIGVLNGCGRSLAFSPDRRTLASGSEDNSIKLWDVANAQNTATLTGHSHFVSSLAFSPDGKNLASGSSDSTIRLWDVASGKNLVTLKSLAPSAVGPVSVAYSSDGKTLASGGSGRKIKLWDAASGNGIVIFDGHSRDASCLAFSPDGKALASGSDGEDNTAKLWDVPLGRAAAGGG